MHLTMGPEFSTLQQYVKKFSRSPLQQNAFYESDCELLALPTGGTLAVTVDAISEEIIHSLYQDPYTMGWVCAAASFSDLAACAATPLGLLFSSQWGQDCTESMKHGIYEGFHDALYANGTHLLGGDTGNAQHTILTSVGLGLCATPPLQRMGIQAGDYAVVFGLTGIGPCLAYRCLLGLPVNSFPESLYRPQVPWQQLHAARPYLRAMMDTSDGVLSTLHTLCALNRVGFHWKWDETTISPVAHAFACAHTIPLFSLMIAEHGDFLQMACVREADLAHVQAHATIHILGQFTETPEIQLQTEKGLFLPSLENAHLLHATPTSEWPRVCAQLLASLRESGYP